MYMCIYCMYIYISKACRLLNLPCEITVELTLKTLTRFRLAYGSWAAGSWVRGTGGGG